MKNLFKYNRKLRLGVGVVAMVASCQLYAAGTLVYCSEASPESFNPQITTGTVSADAGEVPIYNRLVEFKLGTTELLPGLARSWDISPDGMTYTFHLRDDVKWHSNKEFTPTRNLNADDVIFSFMRQKDINHPYHNVSGGQYVYFDGMNMGRLIKEIKKVDDYTVKFYLSQPEAPFLANLAMGFSSILSAEYADKMMKAGTPSKLDLNPIGTGPFILVQYKKDSRILYKANPDYFGEKAKLDRLIFSITPDPSVRYAKLQKNECQIMYNPNPSDVARIKQDSNIVMHELFSINTEYLAYNVEKAPLNNAKVRQALSLAVNKKALVEATYHGAADPAKNFIPPTMWGYNDDVKDYPYDPEKAKALLKEAGFEKGFNIQLWAAPERRRRMAEMIQADWAKIGVKASVVTYEWGEYLARLRKGEHDASIMGWAGDNGDPDNFLSAVMSCDATKAGANQSRWCYQPFDSLILQAKMESNHAKRVQLYKQAQVIMKEQEPVLNIAHRIDFIPARKEVKGYIMDPLGHHHFEQVSIEK